MPFLCVVIVIPLDVAFEILVFLILDPLGVEFELPSGPFDPHKFEVC